MSDPTRMLEGTTSEDELVRNLLDSAMHDGGSERAMERTLAAVGAGVAAGAGPSATGPLGSGPGTLPPLAAKPGAAMLAWKLVAAGVLGGAILLGVSTEWSRGRASTHGPEDRASVNGTISARDPRPVPVPVALSPAPLPAPSAGPVARPASVVSAPPPRPGPTASPPSGASTHATEANDGPGSREDPDTSLRREIAALDEARAALAAKRPRDAIAALDRHRRDFPDAVLQPEAAVLRVHALLDSGDRAAAEAVGARFLGAKSSGPHAGRIRSLLGWRSDDARSNP